MLSLYLLLQTLLSNVFPKKLPVWFIILVAGICIISVRGILEKYVPLFQACYSVFPRNLLKVLLDRVGKMFAVLIFDIFNIY